MADQVGLKLGNYQLVRLLGQGGFAKVYLGEHIYLDTQAAIKVLHLQLGPRALERFLQEAKIIAGLKHPRIVGVLDFGIEEQRPFLVMTYAPHGTLRRCYRSGVPLSPTIILPHVKQIAEALYYAHERKIIHRDVKPENMLLDRDNTVLLSDFGLAVRERSSYQSVHSGDHAGTTTYMAPEQLYGKPCAASDQYALGIVVYEWLCGCLPFDGPDMSVAIQHLHKLPMPLRKHIPTLPVDVETVVMKTLEKDPKQRFANIQEFAEAFEAACKDIPIVPNIALLPFPDTSIAGNISLSSKELQESLSGELIDLLPGFVNGKHPLQSGEVPLVSWNSQHSSPHSPSLSGSPGFNSSEQKPTEMGTLPANSLATTKTLTQNSLATNNSSIASFHPRRRLSRRTALTGIVGLGAVLSGVGLWRVNSSRIGTGSQNGHLAQKSAGSATHSLSLNHRTAGKNGQPVSLSDQSNTPSNKNATSTTNPVTSSKGRSVATSTPSTPSSSGTSTPATTFNNSTSSSSITTSTTASTTASMVKISNVPSVILNNDITHISVTTDVGNVPFQFPIFLFGLKDQNNSPDEPPFVTLTGTTNSSGRGIVSWKLGLSSSKIINGTHVDFYAMVTDAHGKQIISNSAKLPLIN